MSLIARLSILLFAAALWGYAAQANDLGNSSWSETDASNNAASPNGWTSGTMLPTQVEPTARAMMGAIKRWYNHANATVTSGGSANAQTLTYSVTPAALVTGDGFVFKPGFTNTGATTINVNGLGAVAVQRGAAALFGGEIVVSRDVLIFYDGTVFQLANPNPYWVFPGGGLVTSGGSANVQTVSLSAFPGSYILSEFFSFIAGFTNTGAVTLNVNGLGATAVQIGTLALTGGEIVTGRVVQVYYDGSVFQLANPVIPGLYDAAAPSVGCTGLGSTGTCALSARSSDNVGIITLSPSGTGIGSTGEATLTFGGTPGTSVSCVGLLENPNGGGTWTAPATLIGKQGAFQTIANFDWANGGSTALTTGTTYRIKYQCRGF